MVNNTVTAVSDPLASYWNSFVDYLPQLIGAIVVILVGLIVASVVSGIVRKLLELVENNKKAMGFLERWNIKLRLSTFIGRFVWWAIFLIFISATVDILNIPVLTAAITSLVGYLPAVFAATVVAAVALVGAHIIRSLVRSGLEGVGVSASKPLSTLVYIVVLVFGLTAAATQLGIDTTLLTANITIIIGGVVLALALAFGLGGREVAGKLVGQFYESMKSDAPRKNKKK